jgi:hypothetical protein
LTNNEVLALNKRKIAAFAALLASERERIWSEYWESEGKLWEQAGLESCEHGYSDENGFTGCTKQLNHAGYHEYM